MSERIKMFGTDVPVAGDLVFDKEVQTGKMDVDGVEEEGAFCILERRITNINFMQDQISRETENPMSHPGSKL